ncbi:MAG: hypothetical protein NVS2B14_07370 [Chamaesiphon sp.]
MLVILTDDQIISPRQVCQTCLFADQSGQPRWRQGQLSCGHAVRNLSKNQPEQYKCQMGFRLVNID